MQKRVQFNRNLADILALLCKKFVVDYMIRNALQVESSRRCMYMMLKDFANVTAPFLMQ